MEHPIPQHLKHNFTLSSKHPPSHSHYQPPTKQLFKNSGHHFPHMNDLTKHNLRSHLQQHQQVAHGSQDTTSVCLEDAH